MRIIKDLIYEIEIYNDYYKRIRNAVIEKDNIAINIKNLKQNLYCWDIICTCMDRLEDTVEYLDGFQLRFNQYRRSAFDFYELLNNIYVVINCIEELSNIYCLDKKSIESIKNESNFFKDYYDTGGTDYGFFKYIRSLCSVHPIKTNNVRQHKVYLRNANIHSCPYVIWNDKYKHRENGGEISVRIYNSKKGVFCDTINLKIELFEKFLNNWLDFSNVLIKNIKKYYNKVYTDFSIEMIKGENDFDNYVDYMLYLRNENEKRFNYGQEYIFDYYINVFNLVLTNDCNTDILEKYKNAIKLALKYKSASIQSMQTERFEFTGIKKPKFICDNSLFFEIKSPEIFNTDFEKYSYNIEKMYYLLPDSNYSVFDEDWAREQLEEKKPLINKYVYFTNKEPNIETVILVTVAMYFANFEVADSDLNKSIPKNKKYRLVIS